MSIETPEGLPLEYLWLLWPVPVRLRARPIEHDEVPVDQLGVAWHLVDAGVPEDTMLCAWHPKPIAQSSFPREQAERFLASAAVGAWRAPSRILLRVQKPTDLTRIDEPLHGLVFGGLDLSNPEYFAFAAPRQLNTLLFPAAGEDDKEGEVRVAVMPFALGAVVRLPQDRKHLQMEWEVEAVDLLHAIIDRGGEDYRDRILKHATGEI